MLVTRSPHPSSTIPETRALLSVRELERITGVHYQTLYKLAREGRIPGARRLGGRVLISRSIFERWLQSSPRPRAVRRSS